ncbi:VgrG-related protein [Chamaesiphon sp. VAR_48_metabat_403]|uniref:VgrG-related protein n=1 Tax=Chamaesiphon sp. VAR_48_metabat_403 TaxID=2964700 RepID=UPI00286E7AA1|nr:VgrG-related protein [Chamaesiphon sp. VAR_48_metabat_403]
MPNSSRDNHYISELKIDLLSGSSWKSIGQELYKDVLQVNIEESLHLPAMFSIVIHNSYLPASQRNPPWRHPEKDRNLFEIGTRLRMGVVSSTTEDRHFNEQSAAWLIEGEITAIETHFNEKAEAPIIVRGYDLSHRLHRGRHNRSFLNQTDSDIAKQIAKEMKIKVVNANFDDTKVIHEYVCQQNQTNMEFLRDRAAAIGYELFIQEDKLYFQKPRTDTKLTLKWGVDLLGFSTRITSAEQVSAVEVRSWDYVNKKTISSTATSEQVVTATGNNKGSSASTKFDFPAPKITVVDRPVSNAQQSQYMAQALCNELGGEFVYADAKSEGNPLIRPRTVVNLQEMGDRFSGKYYITETRHVFEQRIYKTEFSVRGLRTGNLLSTLSPPIHLKPGQTFLVGIVTDNKDPHDWGRVKVMFPTLTEKHASHWARLVALGAGSQRGCHWIPEINDEVLVGFEHGDIHRPYIIGGVWNGKDAPSEKIADSLKGGKVRLRTLKSRTNHILQFVEEDSGASKAGIIVKSSKDHQVYLNDSEGYIEIKTEKGHTAKLDDRNKCINIETSGGHKITLDDLGKSISISSQGNLSIKAVGNIEIKANGTITINGALISLN